MSLPDARTGSTPDAARLLRAILLSTLFVRFGFGITVAVFASYVVGHSAGIDAGDVGRVGIISALAPVGEFSTVLLSGAAADRYGRIPVLLAGLAVASGMMAIVASTRDPFVIAGCNLVFGVGSGAILASSLAVVADRADSHERGYEMGRFDAMNLLGWVLGFATGFALLGLLPNVRLDLVFLLAFVLLAAGGFVAFGLSRNLELRFHAPPIRVAAIVRAAFRRDVLIVTLPWLVIYMLLGTVFVFLGTAATGSGLPTWELGALIGGGGLLLLATQPAFGRLADRYGRFRLMSVGTAGFVGVLAGAGLLQAFGPAWPILAFTGVSALAALAYGPAALAALADLALVLSRATSMAIYTLTISLGMLVGLAASTTLYSRAGAVGLDLFFASVAVGLSVLTLVRYRDLRTGRSVVGA